MQSEARSHTLTSAGSDPSTETKTTVIYTNICQIRSVRMLFALKSTILNMTAIEHDKFYRKSNKKNDKQTVRIETIIFYTKILNNSA